MTSYLFRRPLDAAVYELIGPTANVDDCLEPEPHDPTNAAIARDIVADRLRDDIAKLIGPIDDSTRGELLRLLLDEINLEAVAMAVVRRVPLPAFTVDEIEAESVVTL